MREYQKYNNIASDHAGNGIAAMRRASSLVSTFACRKKGRPRGQPFRALL
jgi:hypothetical protein